jgi:eukaryotic-like serine/threonine-protein kinase
VSTRCPRCGATYGDEARVCANDGTRLIPVGAGPVSAGPAGAGPAWPDGAPGAAPPRPAPGLPAAATLSGETLGDRYRVERKLGEGGMSYVYLALDTVTSTRVAIKALSPLLSRDANAMARLRREARLGQRLDHPNVCNILALGETPQGLVYIVMPYLEGELLSDRAVRLGVIPLADAVPIVRDIAAGLHAAHELGIVHRDLKPENVMLCRDAVGAERAVVMDLGLAKQHVAGAEAERLTATGIVLGTPEFMSPEQLRGHPLDARSDIYALALMTYELLAGQLPFAGRTQHDMMVARLRAEPVPLRRMRPDLNFPEAVEQVLAKGMARDREERHRTAVAFADAFAAAAAGRAPPEEKEREGWLNRLLGR